MSQLQKASNIKEIYKQFDNQKPLNIEDESFYEEIYCEVVEDLRTELELNDNPSKTFYVSGQSGSGKSTALNFLINDEIKNDYVVKHIRGRELFYPNDVDIIDILLMTGFKLIEDDEELQKEYFEKLNKIKKVNSNQLSEIDETTKETIKSFGVEGDIKLSSKFDYVLDLFKIEFNTNFFAKFKNENKLKKIVREMFAIDKNELIEDLNKIFMKYREKNDNKKLLMIFDDLEKMEIKEQIKSVFVDNRYIFDKLDCVKVLTLPIYLTTKGHFEGDLFRFVIRINNNPIDSNNSELEDEPQNNRDILKRLLKKRLANVNLIDDEALDKAINYSGGNIRSLITIIRKSASKAYKKSEIITKEHIEKVIYDMKKNFAFSIKLDMLEFILNKKMQPKDGDIENDYIESIIDNTVFLYFNGTPWVEINPIIKDTVETYIEKSKDTENIE